MPTLTVESGPLEGQSFSFDTHAVLGRGQMDAQLAQMQQQLASMPPEPRKMVEDMMARQGAGMGGKPNPVRLCNSPEQAERSEVAQHDGNCRQEVLHRSGSTLRCR